MAKNTNITSTYDALPLWLRILIQIVVGVVAGGVYRIVRFFETENVKTLVVGLLVTFTFVGNVISWIIDLACLILNGKYTLFVE